MQSKLGQIKIATNAKSAVLQTYKQHHAQQQQQAAHSIRKVDFELLFCSLYLIKFKQIISLVVGNH